MYRLPFLRRSSSEIVEAAALYDAWQRTERGARLRPLDERLRARAAAAREAYLQARTALVSPSRLAS